MKVVIITGMSGAGRSRAANWFEDQGYYCVDNMPPALINSFLESADFSGKRVILFATSGGSGFGKTVENLQPSAPGARIIEGKVNPSTADIKALAEM